MTGQALGRVISGLRLSRGAFALFATLALLAACAFPTHDRSTLAAIRAESLVLMKSRPTGTHATLPKSRWPRAIASLEPEFVIVAPEGVEIVTKPYFDGGWGYFVPADEQWPPDPAGRYSALAEGVYWFHPY